MNFYQLNTTDVLRQLQTHTEGLTAEEADRRLRQYGPNKITDEKRTSRLKIFGRQFASPLIYILLTLNRNGVSWPRFIGTIEKK